MCHIFVILFPLNSSDSVKFIYYKSTYLFVCRIVCLFVCCVFCFVLNKNRYFVNYPRLMKTHDIQLDIFHPKSDSCLVELKILEFINDISLWLRFIPVKFWLPIWMSIIFYLTQFYPPSPLYRYISCFFNI